MLGQEELIKKGARFANLIIGGALFCCVVTLLYFLYYYHWTHERYFTSLVGPVLSYILPATSATLLLVALRLRPSYRINLALLLLSLGVATYAVELGLAFTMRTIDEQVVLATAARALGVPFDTRSKLEVITDFEKHDVHAVPNIDPKRLLEGDELRRSAIIINDTETLPLGGIANRVTVVCNESGEYLVYVSDEHGFHNPQGLWDAHPLQIAAVGDSFTHGACVPSDKHFIALIRKSWPATLNLGQGANGPLLEFAALQEYVPALKPPIVLWSYFEGNDLEDLGKEKHSPLLMSYLTHHRTQNILHQQASIDQALLVYIDMAIKAPMARVHTIEALFGGLQEIIKLGHVRLRLGLVSAKSQRQAQDMAQNLDLLQQILWQAKTLIETWGGTLYFVSLPERMRYSNPPMANEYRDRVLAAVSTLGIPLIDLHPVFQAHGDPLALFPFRIGYHYTEEGQRLVAEEILRALAHPDVHSMFKGS